VVRPEEQAAAALLAGLLDMIPTVHDRPGAGPGLYDFKLHAEDLSHFYAVEVTMHADPAHVSFWNARERDRFREVPDLDGTHIVWIAPDANRKQLWKHLPAILPRLPADLLVGVDIANARWNRADGTPTPDEELLLSLGVSHIRVAAPPAPSAILLTTSDGGWLDAGAVVDAAMAEVEPNREKLAAAVDAAERHLFVWIDPSRFRASISLDMRPVPSTPAPDLGPGVDVLWVAAPDTTYRATRLWRADSGSTWSDWTPRLPAAD
jgi:hypothetical protein